MGDISQIEGMTKETQINFSNTELSLWPYVSARKKISFVILLIFFSTFMASSH